MKRLIITTLWLALLFAGPGWTQVRNVTINTTSPEGQLLQQAADEKDSSKKIVLLEQFLTQYPNHEAVGYVHLLLQGEYLKTSNWDKSIEHGQAAQAKAPDDLEIAHFLVKGVEGKGDAQMLVQTVEKAHDLAVKANAKPKPADADEVDAWKRSIDFATQVDQYNQYALYESAQKQTAPQNKLLLLDMLRKDFPGGQFDKQLDAHYVVLYQQLGQTDKMVQAAQAALAGDPSNEGYLYLVGEALAGKGQASEAETYGKKILDTLPAKPKPENMSDEEWTKRKNTYLGLAHWLIGRGLASQDKFVPAHKELVAAATALKGNNEMLGGVYYYLGLSSAKLNRQGEAVNYLTQSSKIAGPYQAYAADTLKKIRAALAGR
jgi:tetratricopeptide (TPR) repeat protein